MSGGGTDLSPPCRHPFFDHHHLPTPITMRKKTLAFVSAVVLVGAASAYAHRALHPRWVEPPTSNELFDAALLGGDAAAAAAHAGGFLQALGAPLWSSQDHRRAVEFALYEGTQHWIAVFRPHQAPPAYAGHTTEPTLPAYGFVEIEQFGLTTHYAMAQIGPALVTALPKSAVSFSGGITLRLGAWAEGSAFGDPQQAFYWAEVPVWALGA